MAVVDADEQYDADCSGAVLAAALAEVHPVVSAVAVHRAAASEAVASVVDHPVAAGPEFKLTRHSCHTRGTLKSN